MHVRLLRIAAGAFALTVLESDGAARQIGAGGLSLAHAAVLMAYVAFMFGVCMLACIVPTWRALRVVPTDALRVE